ncbi:MAG: hypothetical protein WAR38_12450, partial [Chitinophagaceae bacterium]
MNYLKGLLRFQVIVTLCSVMLVRCSSGPTVSPVDEKGNTQTIFFDDFSGPVLDSSKWNKEVTGMHVNNELQAYIDSTNVIRLVTGPEAEGAENGALVLQPYYSPGYITKDSQKFDFISGRINTRSKVEFTYGSA